MKSFIQTFFLGNYFYGFLAILLTIESSIQHDICSNPVLLFWIGITTVWFYTIAYQQDIPKSNLVNNFRAQWYYDYKKHIEIRQYTLIAGILGLFIYFISRYYSYFTRIDTTNITVLLLTCLVGFAYHGATWRGKAYTLRGIGVIKPFLIGISWASMVGVLPFIVYNVQHPDAQVHINYFLFLKNVLFISSLSIMFDIKDAQADSSDNIKTFIVRMGLKKTIYNILIPLNILSWICFIQYGIFRGYTSIQILTNTIPFGCSIILSLSLLKSRPILYYLIIVDGLMLVKAICGIIAVHLS